MADADKRPDDENVIFLTESQMANNRLVEGIRAAYPNFEIRPLEPMPTGSA